MSLSLASSSSHLSNLRPDAHNRPHMSILRRLNLRTLDQSLRPLNQNLRAPPPPSRRRLAVSAAVRQDTTVWTQAPITTLDRAAESLFHVSIDVSDSPDLVASHTRPGQYLQLRVPDVEKPSFLAIASPPSFSAARGEFEFLVKSVGGSTAEILCKLGKGDLVELTHVNGKGFEVERIEPAEEFSTVLIFATGSGISPVRSLIESGFSADKRSDVRLYYGARNLERMAYQDRFEAWEATGVKIVPVLSQPDDRWKGEHGYVQNAFVRSQQKFNPLSTGVVLCGQKQMTEEVTDLLTASGVSNEKILKNF